MRGPVVFTQPHLWFVRHTSSRSRKGRRRGRQYSLRTHAIQLFHLGRAKMIALIFMLLFGSSHGELHEVASWHLLTFTPPTGYPGASPYGYPINAPNTVFTGLEVTNDRLYLSMPRYFSGQPITLGWVPKPRPGTRLPQDLSINPFPDWGWHRLAAANSSTSNCSGLISVYRTRVDHCNRLWVLDTGNMNSSPGNCRPCLPKLVVFDLNSGKMVRRIEFRRELLEADSLLVNLVLDTRMPAGVQCDSIFIYIADSTAPAIIVYDVQRDRVWRISNPQMFPSPDKGIFKVADETFILMDGITGMALSAPSPGIVYRPETGYTQRILYFQPLSSDRIFAVNTSELQSGPKAAGALPIVFLGQKPSQGAPLAVDQTNGTVLFSSVSESWVVSWHPQSGATGLLAYNTNLLQFVLDLVVQDKQVWAISTRFQKFFNKKVNPNEVNLRILRIDRT